MTEARPRGLPPERAGEPEKSAAGQHPQDLAPCLRKVFSCCHGTGDSPSSAPSSGTRARSPDKRLVLKIAETQEELEQCFTLLHDAYVGAGFMKPAPSGLRATIYHPLPTTTTLCAKTDRVVGTLSLIRESVFGFPLRRPSSIRRTCGLAAARSPRCPRWPCTDFRKTGGAILFPLMKFMYEYCTTFFDTRHLVIAVHRPASRCTSRCCSSSGCRRTRSTTTTSPTVRRRWVPRWTCATRRANTKQVYDRKKRNKNLYDYFVRTRLPNIQLPNRRYYTTNDLVMTTDLLDHFFNNQRTQVFAQLGMREKVLLHSIYNLPDHQRMLPPMEWRRGRRWQAPAPAPALFDQVPGQLRGRRGRQAQRHAHARGGAVQLRFPGPPESRIPDQDLGQATIQLGNNEQSTVQAMAVRGKDNGGNIFYGFTLAEPDRAWRKFVSAPDRGRDA